MVLGLLTITSIPTIIGVSEAVSAQKKQNAQAKEQTRFHLLATFPPDSVMAGDAYVVLTDGRVEFESQLLMILSNLDMAIAYTKQQLYLDHLEQPTQGHKFDGYYFTYPCEEQHRGLVSTITDDSPMLNWIFVDNDTLTLHYGRRQDTVGQIIGPWGWSENEEFLTLNDDESFVAVEEQDGKWAVYFDHQGNLEQVLRDKVWVKTRLMRKMTLGVESRRIRG